MYDTHLHTKFSHDGKSALADYIKVAEIKGMKGIGITDHLDFVYSQDYDTRFDYNAYSDEIDKLKNRGYKIYKGIELGYVINNERRIYKGIEGMTFDYRIGAVHRVDGISMSTKRFSDFILSEDNHIQIIQKYYNSVRSSLEMEFIDVIAHIGVFKKYFPNKMNHSSELYNITYEMETALAEECAKSEKIIEVNTSGLFTNFGQTIPDIRFLKEYYMQGGRRISIGSDAHMASDLMRGMDVALGILRSIGFTYIYLPWDQSNFVLI